MDGQIFILFFGFYSIVFGLLQTTWVKNLLKNKNYFFYLLAVITIGQISSIFLFEHQVGDVMLFGSAGNYLRQKIDFYWIDADHTQYPFFPFLIFLFAGLDWLTTIMPKIYFSIFLKLILLIPLHFLAHWIKSRSVSNQIGRQKYLEFISSPITFGVIFFHGQIDLILMSFLVLSGIFLHSKNSVKSGLFASSLAFAASVASKTWSILLLPLMLIGQKNLLKSVIYLAVVGACLLLDLFIYTRYVSGSSISFVAGALLKPGGPIGSWGATYFFPHILPFVLKYKLFVFGGLTGLGYLFLLKKPRDLWQNISMMILWLYLIAIHWGVQYLFWIMPFLVDQKSWLGEKWANLCHFLACLYVLGCYLNIAANSSLISIDLINQIGLVLWLVYLYKFLELVFRHQNRPETFNRLIKQP